MIAFTLLWRVPTLSDPPWLNDEGVYAEVGKTLLQGTALYRQIWENKPPAIYLLYGTVHELLGPTHLLFAVRLLALLAALVAQVAVYRLARRGLGRGPALLATALAGAGLNLPLLDGTTANAEIFIVALTAPAMLLVWRSVDHAGGARGGGAAPAALAGVLLGIAVLFKLVAVMDVLAALALLIAGSRGHGKAPAAFLLAGVLLPLAITAAWLSWQGLLGEALYATIGYNEGYVATGQGMHAPLLSLALVAVPLSLLLAGCMVLRGRRRGPASAGEGERLFAAASLWWCALALIGALASGRSYLHYYLQALPPACLCLALGFRGASRQRERAARLALGALLLLWVLAVPLASWQAVAATRPGDAPGARAYGYYGYAWQRLTGTLSQSGFDDRLDARVRRNVAVGEYLRTHTAVGQRLYVWGNAPWIYYLSRGTPAARFLSAYYHPAIPGGTEQVIADLRRLPPEYIVVIEPPLPASPALSAFVRARYRRVWVYRQAVIYRRAR